MDSKDTKEMGAIRQLPPTKLQPSGQEPQEQLLPKQPSGQLKLNQPKPVKAQQKPTRLQRYGRVGQWFQVLCFMNVPVLGFIYMLILAIRKKTPPYKKSFAVAYILYRILVMTLAVIILFILYKVGLSFIDEILKYAGGSL
ncbi:MAG: hypothetical protein HFH69_09695 [Lachnospiraceae bacterium]|nr:hypothetical protein [Lachnospiraceae bacterium]